MHTTTASSIILLVVLTPITILAQSQNPNGPCVTTCTTTKPTSSLCNGDETGSALDKRECSSFSKATALLTCIKACPANEQAIFASHLPALCRDQLLPGVTPASSSSSRSAATTTAASAGSTTTTPTTVGGVTPTTSAGAGAGATTSSKPNGVVSNLKFDLISVMALACGAVAVLVM